MADKKDKPSLSSMSSLIRKTAQEGGDSPKRKYKEARNKVGSLHSPAMQGNRKERQVMYLHLPVSKADVKCELTEFDPDELKVSKFNKRSQSLLTAESPSVIDLKNRIYTEEQNDPVLVRRNENGELEVVYGSRRRFVIDLLNKNEWKDSPRKLKAWYFHTIPDIDAKRLSDSENEDKEPISSWEKSQYFLDQQRSDPSLTDENLAALEGIARPTLINYLRLGALPEEVVALVSSPNSISVTSGVAIEKTFREMSADLQKEIVKALSKKKYFPNGGDLLKAMRAEIQSLKSSPKPLAKNKKIEVKTNSGKVMAVIGSHRTKANHYKIDLIDIDRNQLDQIESLIRGLAKKG